MPNKKKTQKKTNSGLYLLGIVRAGGPEVHLRGAELITEGPLAAVVQRVRLQDFSPEAIEARFRDKARLEATVREHDRLIEDLHRQCAMLPAKFGAVYEREEDVRFALSSRRVDLLDAIERVDDHDEWVVHLHVDERDLGRAVKEKIAHPSEKRPGHAYFQQRKEARETEQAMNGARDELANAGFDAIVQRADEGRILSPFREEVMRAAFLVRRKDRNDFLASLRDFADAHTGVHWEYSGPLPPYDFVAEEAAA